VLVTPFNNQTSLRCSRITQYRGGFADEKAASRKEFAGKATLHRGIIPRTVFLLSLFLFFFFSFFLLFSFSLINARRGNAAAVAPDLQRARADATNVAEL